MRMAHAKTVTVNQAQDSSANIAIEFVGKLRPGGPWTLTAIIPDGSTETITATNAGEVGAFVRSNDGKKNIYYSVNPTRTTMTSAPNG